MKLAIVIGTRPEIIKMAPIVRACEAREVPFVLVHTGQHYSRELDGVFFEELDLPAPEANLSVGSGTQAYQVGAIVLGLERVLADRKPDIVLVQGDTNSVVAAALGARACGVRVGHVEAGLRSYDRTMPEELNRILADHISDVLFAPTANAGTILRAEGIAAERVHVTGNTVVDEVLLQRARADREDLLEEFGVTDRGYALATVHRAENTDSVVRLGGIVAGLRDTAAMLGVPVLAALHPRTVLRLRDLGLEVTGGVRVLPPLGYLDFLGLESHAALVLTDSGGLQEEACVLQVPCVTLRDNTERPESIEAGANMLAGATPENIVECARIMFARARGWPNPFGDGHSGERIVELLTG